MHKYKTHVVYNEAGRLRRPAEETLAELIITRYEAHPDPVVIAIGGPGGTGKSTISRELCRLLPDSAVLTLDDYKTPSDDLVKHLESIIDEALELLSGRPAGDLDEEGTIHHAVAERLRKLAGGVRSQSNQRGHATWRHRYGPQVG